MDLITYALLNKKSDSISGSIAELDFVTATKPHATGDQFIVDGVLCTATESIDVGDTIEIGTNCKVSENLVDQIAEGGGGTTDYNQLDNKPSIEGHTLSGDMTLEDIGDIPITDEVIISAVDNAFQANTDNPPEESVDANEGN